MTAPRCSRCGSGASGRFRTYEDVIRHMDGLGLFHMDMGLGRMERALTELRARRLPCPVVQVVGTNGKGSTATFLQSLAMAHGFRAGLYTSPHFLSPAERIRMGSRSLPEAAWPDLAERACAAVPDLTYFELLTVMAVLAFQDSEPDLLIFEAGLGGRHDATSAIPADLICFTPFGLDHQDVLGPDLAAIAEDKADAMRQGMFAAVSSPQPPEAAEILARKASGTNLPLYFPDRLDVPPGGHLEPGLRNLVRLADSADLGLYGPHQRLNAATALTAWALLCRHQGWRTDERAVRRGLADAFLPGRMQRIPATEGMPPFLLDGAHNAHGMAALRAALNELSAREGIRPSAVVFSCLADKHPENLVPLAASLAGNAPVFLPTIGGNARAAAGGDLAKLFPADGPRTTVVPDLAAALEAARRALAAHPADGPVLVCGSLYLLAEFFKLFPSALHQRGA